MRDMASKREAKCSLEKTKVSPLRDQSGSFEGRLVKLKASLARRDRSHVVSPGLPFYPAKPIKVFLMTQSLAEIFLALIGNSTLALRHSSSLTCKEKLL